MGKIIILFFLLSVSNNYFSSHILGGDVSLEQIGPNNYRVKLRFFRYCTGSAGPNSINNAKIYNGATDSLATTFSLNKDSVIIESYKCVTTSSVCKEIFY